MKHLKKLLKDEDAQGMTEYIIIVVVVALAAIGAWRFFASKLKTTITSAANTLPNP